MPSEDIDRAIDLLVVGAADPENALHSVILGETAGFVVACNEISIRVAQRFLGGSLSFGDADDVMNWLWSYVTAWLVAANGERPMPEPMYSIYDVIDAGEYAHPRDPSDVDPVLKYTIPALESVVESLPPST